MEVQIENPLCRVPVSMILDDSCPVVNLSHFWIKLRENRSTADIPVEIPVSFLRKFGDWCQEHGVKGKFSFVPMPAGLGTIDLGLPGFSRAHLDEWIEAAREIIWPNFDFTPEMITHCKIVDLSDWTMTDEWEQVEWADNPVPADRLAPYIAAALRILRNIDIPAEGVTSPGAFGRKDLAAYGSATLWAQKDVNGNSAPFFFCEVEIEGDPSPEIYALDRENGEASVHIRACTGDYFAGWEGNNRDAIHSPDACITEDLQGGRVAEAVSAGWPAIMVSHWPGFYFQGEEIGFGIFKVVVERINQLPNILWMKTSEIASYWLAREIVRTEVTHEGCQIHSPITCPGFTLRVTDAPSGAWSVGGEPLTEASGPLSLKAGTWAQDGRDVVLAFDLQPGSTVVDRAG
jgi:hypothetical protein